MKRIISGVIIALLLTNIVGFLHSVPSVSSNPGQVGSGFSSSWWDSDWEYRKSINISEISENNLSSFPLEVTFEHSGNLNANGTDIRVIDKSLEIPSCVEEYNATHVTVMFEINLTALRSKTVYIYYGNPSALAPNYPLVPLSISEGNSGNAVIDNSVYLGWDFTSWGWSNNVELWNDFRIDFNKNGNPLDDSDLIRDDGSRQGGIGRLRADTQAIGLSDYVNYSQTPMYVDINFANARLRVYRNHPWIETTQADYMHMFSPSYTHMCYCGGTEENLMDGIINFPEGGGTRYTFRDSPGWMAFRDDASGYVFASTGYKIGSDYAYEIGGKEASQWDRNLNYNNRTRYEPVLPYDQPSDCRIYWYGDNSNNYSKIEETAAVLMSPPEVVVVPDMIAVPDDCPTIQEAINAASGGDTVLVRNGTYYENIVVNKTVCLVGESKETTIIDGQMSAVISLSSNDTTISNFTVQNGDAWQWSGIQIHGFNNMIVNNIIEPGIRIDYCANNTIESNIVYRGIELWFADDNKLMQNLITGCTDRQGIRIEYGSENNYVASNNLIGNWGGIYISTVSSATVFGNNVTNCSYEAIIVGDYSNVVLFHNNIVGNCIVDLYHNNEHVVWDDGYPSGGNYWSDYAGADLFSGHHQNETGSDGIGDTPYVIDSSNQDNYPLTRPYVPFDNQTIYIRADGSVDPSGAPVQWRGDLYVLTENITSSSDGIVIERDNIAVDGEGYTVTGSGIGSGTTLMNRSNVTLRRITIANFAYGIWLSSSSNNVLSDNTATANIWYGILLNSSSNNVFCGNNVANNSYGILLNSSPNNTFSANTVTANGNFGIWLGAAIPSWLSSSPDNVFSDNNITKNNYGIIIDDSPNNILYRNNFANNGYEALVLGSHNNFIFHNSFTNNTSAVGFLYNTWDDGYPSGGNYWSGYSGIDSNGDGIGDTPYALDTNNTDNYPLMNPWSPPNIAVTNLTSAKTVIGQGYTTSVNVNFENLGNKIEAFNATVYVNETSIDSETLMLMMGNSTVVGFNWNTSGFAYGNYMLSASASILDIDTNFTNNFNGGWVVVTIPGDLNGNFNVSLQDLVILANAYGSTPQMPSKWNPNADISDNGIVDLSDLVIMAIHYGQHYP